MMDHVFPFDLRLGQARCLQTLLQPMSGRLPVHQKGSWPEAYPSGKCHNFTSKQYSSFFLVEPSNVISNPIWIWVNFPGTVENSPRNGQEILILQYDPIWLSIIGLHLLATMVTDMARGQNLETDLSRPSAWGGNLKSNYLQSSSISMGFSLNKNHIQQGTPMTNWKAPTMGYISLKSILII